MVFPENYLFTEQLTRVGSTSNWKTCLKQLVKSSRSNAMGYFQTDVLHFFICGEREEHQSFHLILSDHKLVCFQPQNVNKFFSAVFIGLLSAKGCSSRIEHSFQELLHLTASNRITQIQNVKGQHLSWCLPGCFVSGEKKSCLNTWVVILFQLSSVQVFYYRSGLYQQNIPFPNRWSNFKTIT